MDLAKMTKLLPTRIVDPRLVDGYRDVVEADISQARISSCLSMKQGTEFVLARLGYALSCEKVGDFYLACSWTCARRPRARLLPRMDIHFACALHEWDALLAVCLLSVDPLCPVFYEEQDLARFVPAAMTEQYRNLVEPRMSRIRAERRRPETSPLSTACLDPVQQFLETNCLVLHTARQVDRERQLLRVLQTQEEFVRNVVIRNTFEGPIGSSHALARWRGREISTFSIGDELGGASTSIYRAIEEEIRQRRRFQHTIAMTLGLEVRVASCVRDSLNAIAELTRLRDLGA